MKSKQFNARISPKAFDVLNDLSKRLHTTKGHLTEKAIYLLKEHFDSISQNTGKDKQADIFLSLLGDSKNQYDDLYKKLAE